MNKETLHFEQFSQHALKLEETERGLWRWARPWERARPQQDGRSLYVLCERPLSRREDSSGDSGQWLVVSTHPFELFVDGHLSVTTNAKPPTTPLHLSLSPTWRQLLLRVHPWVGSPEVRWGQAGSPSLSTPSQSLLSTPLPRSNDQPPSRSRSLTPQVNALEQSQPIAPLAPLPTEINLPERSIDQVQVISSSWLVRPQESDSSPAFLHQLGVQKRETSLHLLVWIPNQSLVDKPDIPKQTWSLWSSQKEVLSSYQRQESLRLRYMDQGLLVSLTARWRWESPLWSERWSTQPSSEAKIFVQRSPFPWGEWRSRRGGSITPNSSALRLSTSYSWSIFTSWTALAQRYTHPHPASTRAQEPISPRFLTPEWLTLSRDDLEHPLSIDWPPLIFPTASHTLDQWMNLISEGAKPIVTHIPAPVPSSQESTPSGYAYALAKREAAQVILWAPPSLDLPLLPAPLPFWGLKKLVDGESQLSTLSGAPIPAGSHWLIPEISDTKLQTVPMPSEEVVIQITLSSLQADSSLIRAEWHLEPWIAPEELPLLTTRSKMSALDPSLSRLNSLSIPDQIQYISASLRGVRVSPQWWPPLRDRRTRTLLRSWRAWWGGARSGIPEIDASGLHGWWVDDLKKPLFPLFSSRLSTSNEPISIRRQLVLRGLDLATRCRDTPSFMIREQGSHVQQKVTARGEVLSVETSVRLISPSDLKERVSLIKQLEIYESRLCASGAE